MACAIGLAGRAEPIKPKLKWLAIVLAVLLLGFGTALFLWPRDRITAESWQKIRIGMTEKEVVEILGGPGMKFEEFEEKFLIQLEEPELLGGDELITLQKTRFWRGSRRVMLIHFNQEGRVNHKALSAESDLNFIDRLRDWLGW